MAAHVFRARLWEHDPGEHGSWHFLTLQAEVSDDIALEAGPGHGFGTVRVEVTIGSTTWRTSLFPASGRESLVLPVKKKVRYSEGLRAGRTYEVALDVSHGGRGSQQPAPGYETCQTQPSAADEGSQSG